MTRNHTRALSDVLDHLEDSVHGDSIAVEEVVEKLGRKSFASLMLIFSLICVSPASAIPGFTAVTGIILALLAVQMIFGRECVWLPDSLGKRRLSTQKLCKGIGWLRRPVDLVERVLRPRLSLLFHRPWLYLPLIPITFLAAGMPLLELVPASGSIAAAVIAVFAMGLLTRDGTLVAASMMLLMAAPVAVWYFVFGA